MSLRTAAYQLKVDRSVISNRLLNGKSYQGWSFRKFELQSLL